MLRPPRLEGLHTVLQLLHLVTQSAHRGVYGRRGLLPVLRGEGKRPAGIGGLSHRFHDVSKRQTTALDG
jgi:hypothetical protein